LAGLSRTSNIDLQLNPNEILGVVGDKGAGGSQPNFKSSTAGERTADVKQDSTRTAAGGLANIVLLKVSVGSGRDSILIDKETRRIS
jgi:hypothetical protein